MPSQPQNMPFIKNLASSDRKTRTAALDSLRTFLSAKHISSSLQLLDILKLWKGLFYALWMCDRPLPQQALAAELADLIYVLPREAVVPWLRGFWATMSREWTGIDVLRMEKFLMLVRRVLAASLKWTQEVKVASAKTPKKSTRGKNVAAAEEEDTRMKLDIERVDEILELLAEWPFRPDRDSEASTAKLNDDTYEALMPKTVPVGLKLHVLDIWVDEVEKAGMLDEETDSGDTDAKDGPFRGMQIVKRINTLIEALQATAMSPAVKIRSKDSLADDRLPWVVKDLKDVEMAEDGEWGGLDD